MIFTVPMLKNSKKCNMECTRCYGTGQIPGKKCPYPEIPIETIDCSECGLCDPIDCPECDGTGQNSDQEFNHKLNAADDRQTERRER